MRSAFASSVVVLLLLVACRQPELPHSPTGLLDASSRRTTSLGDVVGAAAPFETHSWLGIPFAAPPTGTLRWRAPRAPHAWDGTREALADTPACIQFDPRETGDVMGSENCLYLNVFAPRFLPDEIPSEDAALPVLFWIHGGGNTVGAPSQYDPTRLVNAHQVIVVTTAYRLGTLGWFRHASLTEPEDSAEDQSGNFGILDQQVALRWVKQNIQTFGGDSTNVTIFGESAGGRDIAALLASPLSNDLFQRAIVQSGAGRTLTPAESEHAIDAPDPGVEGSSTEILLKLLQQDGSAEDRAGARAQVASWDSEHIARYFRNKTPSELLSAVPRMPMGMYKSPQMFRDGSVLPETDLYTVFAEGRTQPVPAIFGTNRDEDKLFMLGKKSYTWKLFGMPRVRDAARYERDAAYRSQLWKARGADELASAMQRGGRRVYVYRFDWDELASPAGIDFPRLLGAAHALELPFVFGNFDNFFLGDGALYDEDNALSRAALSQAMMSYWVQFARTGDPARGLRGELPEWRGWRAKDAAPEFLVLDSQADGGIRMERGRISAREIIAAVREDDTFKAGERCFVLDEMAKPGDLFDRSDLLAEGCPAQLATR